MTEEREKELLALLDRLESATAVVDLDAVIDATRAVVADNAALRRQVASMRDALSHAAPVVEALFNAAKDQLLPVWAMLAPYLEQAAPMGTEWDEKTAAGYETDPEPKPRHLDRGTCKVCGKGIKYFEKTAWNGLEEEVLNAWWSHYVHPADGHDAQPVDRLEKTDPEPTPKIGDRGTCCARVGSFDPAVCGYEIVFTKPAADREGVLAWKHVDSMIDGTHRAQFGGPA